MPGKKTNKKKNFGAAEAFVKHQREGRDTDVIAKTSQEMYRRAALATRAAENRLTDKNRAEMKRLGM